MIPKKRFCYFVRVPEVNRKLPEVDTIRQIDDHTFGKRSPGSKPEAPGSEIDSKASSRQGQHLV